MKTSPNDLHLKEITAATLREVVDLSVKPEQADYVASNVYSIAQAYFHPEAWFRGVYDGDTPVGFAMLEDWSLVPEKFEDQPVVLWRFMIDQRFQGSGYGHSALEEVCRHVRTRTRLDHFLTSCVEGPFTPKPFYIRFGFVETGLYDEGEAVLRYDFRGQGK